MEPCLYVFNDYRYRHAMAQLKSSSHILHNRGRYTYPRTPRNERLYPLCNYVEDELHFGAACIINQTERDIFMVEFTLNF